MVVLVKLSVVPGLEGRLDLGINGIATWDLRLEIQTGSTRQAKRIVTQNRLEQMLRSTNKAKTIAPVSMKLRARWGLCGVRVI